MTERLPLVSVCCLTYNHHQYIERALDSILGQKINFAIEIIVHDDASSDGTAEIIHRYAKTYPETVKPIYQQPNLLRSGTGIFQIYTDYVFPFARGKYIAICEGDDFWTDTEKLQLQTDYMEKHPACTVCFHKAGILKNEETDFDIYEKYHKEILGNRDEFTFDDLLKDNIIPNCSVVYKNVINEFPDLFSSLIFPDWPLHLLYAEKGEIGYINKFMAVHHEHEMGMWNGDSIINRVKSIIGFYLDLLKYLDVRYHPAIFESLDRYTHGLQPVDFGKDFEIAYNYGAAQKQQELNLLQNDLNTIFQSGSWKLAQKISRWIKYPKHVIRIRK